MQFNQDFNFKRLDAKIEKVYLKKNLSYYLKKKSFQLNSIHSNAALDSDALDIDNYLPIKTTAEAISFCENNDGLLEQRKKALQRRVYATSDTSNLANFVASVADIFFRTNYQISHRWPSKTCV